MTIVTKDRLHYFGEVANGKMVLSEIGEIAEQEWLRTPELRPDMNLKLGEFVVMPNHFHAIISIGENEFNRKNVQKEALELGSPIKPSGDTIHCVPTVGYIPTNHYVSSGDQSIPPLAKEKNKKKKKPKNQFGPQSKNLASVIRGFKIGVTKYARVSTPDFAWQSRFYDHIIGEPRAYSAISKYIVDNPGNWEKNKGRK